MVSLHFDLTTHRPAIDVASFIPRRTKTLCTLCVEQGLRMGKKGQNIYLDGF